MSARKHPLWSAAHAAPDLTASVAGLAALAAPVAAVGATTITALRCRTGSRSRAARARHPAMRLVAIA